jgi:hypothetical protein
MVSQIYAFVQTKQIFSLYMLFSVNQFYQEGEKEGRWKEERMEGRE